MHGIVGSRADIVVHIVFFLLSIRGDLVRARAACILVMEDSVDVWVVCLSSRAGVLSYLSH